ncbi:MAG: C40 family peptidase [Tissierellia bacterium]|nr:C40 family peptidase [Tissierellia bacterium]
MRLSKRSLPVGLAFVCLVGIVGFKDTGIFVNQYTAKSPNGVTLNYVPNDRAEIISESETEYIITQDGIKYNVPKVDLLKIDKGIKSYKVIKSSSIIDPNTGEIERMLFTDEVLEHVGIKDNKYIARTAEGFVGFINPGDMEFIRDRNITQGHTNCDIVLEQDGKQLKLIKDEAISIAWFQEDYFIIFDAQGNKFNIGKQFVDLSEKTAAESVIQPQATEEQEDPNLKDNLPPSNSTLEEAQSKIVELEKEFTKAKDTDYEKAAILVAKAHEYLGAPYVYADAGKAGFDCSGLTYALYGELFDIKLPRSSKTQITAGVRVSKENLQPGDLVFFRTTSSGNISHVGLYIGDDTMIHASSSKASVIKSKLSEKYYAERYMGAVRVLNNN